MPRAREEVVRAFLDQPQREAGLVHVVVIVLTDLAEGLDADGQFFPTHRLGLRQDGFALVERTGAVADAGASSRQSGAAQVKPKACARSRE
jgi:hypothetical protein